MACPRLLPSLMSKGFKASFFLGHLRVLSVHKYTPWHMPSVLKTVPVHKSLASVVATLHPASVHMCHELWPAVRGHEHAHWPVCKLTI